MRALRTAVGILLLGCSIAVGMSAQAATVTCNDGTTAKAGRGACSHHGGVAKAGEPAPSAKGAPKERSQEPAEIVTCHDGTTAKAGRGACSHHGGLAAGTPAPETGETPATGGTVACKDGTASKPGRGACSHHGGVREAAATPPAAAPQSPRATVPTNAGAPKSGEEKDVAASPTGATARCKDGTYSHARHHQGACSHHGGVAEWMK